VRTGTDGGRESAAAVRSPTCGLCHGKARAVH
jgi:hypothetical protein